MSYDAIKYARGTVWWCEDVSHTTVPGVQSGTRPCLIISNNDRGSSSVVEVLKITSNTDRSSVCSDINVSYDLNGYSNVIMCNQHSVVPVSSLRTYMCTLSDKTMAKVERAMLIAQGMRSLADLNDKYMDLQTLVQTIADERLRNYQMPEVDVGSEIGRIITGLHTMINTAQTNLIAKGTKPSKHTVVDKSEDESQAEVEVSMIPTQHVAEVPSETKVSKPKTTNKGRGYWTTERMKEFINDKKTLPLTEVRDKWNLSSNKVVHQYYYLFKQRLGDY